MNIPIELILTVILSALGGALIPAIGLWLQFRQNRRELSIRHEELVFEKRLDTALSISDFFYRYFDVSHRYRSADDTDYKKALSQELFDLGKQIQELEAKIVLLFPSTTVKTYRTYLSVVGEIRKSHEIHWTVVGARLDDAYHTLIGLIRDDIGITTTESNLAKTLLKDT